MKTTNKNNFLKVAAFSLLTLCSISSFAQPAPGSPAYDAWKMSQVAPGPSAPLGGTVNAPTGSAPGCFFAPDASYSTLAGNDDGSTGLIALPFTFNLYGTAYTSCYINNNGNITFGGPTGAFSSSGFPTTGFPMVAPFWADVDTRCGSLMHYKVESNRLIVSWPGVGVFPASCALLNTFQMIISDGTDPAIGIGNNVAFYYGDMQWTTGSASGGSGGFGGVPATAGINAGNGVDYVQIGRFDANNGSYDGGGGNNDGVNYLDYECFTFNASGSGNLPPSVSGAPAGNVINIPYGTTSTLLLSFLPPEVAQQVSTLINTGGLCNTVVNFNTSGAVSNTSVSITGDACNVGTHHIIYTATDNFGTPASTVVDITVNVLPPSNVPTMSEWSLIILSLLSLAIGMVFIYRRQTSFSFAKK
ncbi:MAG: hypothetical protein IPI46_09615 [Bacteroidetes bacterium]|nr:hypothetical protein [Bacteroidota bacterium]